MSNNRQPSSNARRATPYASEAEMQSDMAQAQYNSDPAFRDHVRQRIAASDLWQTYTDFRNK